MPRKPLPITLALALLITASLLAGCGLPTSLPTPAPNTPTPTVPTALPPSPTPLPLPSPTPEPEFGVMYQLDSVCYRLNSPGGEDERLTPPGDTAAECRFSPDGSRVAYKLDGRLAVYATATGAVTQMDGSSVPMWTDLAWSRVNPDQLTFINVLDQMFIYTVSTNTAGIFHGPLDGKPLAVKWLGSQDALVYHRINRESEDRVLVLRRGAEEFLLTPELGQVGEGFDVSPDGSLLAYRYEDPAGAGPQASGIYLQQSACAGSEAGCDVTAVRIADTAPGLVALAFDPGGQRLAYECASGGARAVCLYDLGTQQTTALFTAPDPTADRVELDWSPDGSTLLAALYRPTPEGTAFYDLVLIRADGAPPQAVIARGADGKTGFRFLPASLAP